MSYGVKLTTRNGVVMLDSTSGVEPAFCLVLDVILVKTNESRTLDYSGRVTNVNRLSALETVGPYTLHHTISISSGVITVTSNTSQSYDSYVVISYI